MPLDSSVKAILIYRSPSLDYGAKPCREPPGTPRHVPNSHAAKSVGPNRGSGEVLRDPEEREMILARGGRRPGKESRSKWPLIGPLIQVRRILVDVVWPLHNEHDKQKEKCRQTPGGGTSSGVGGKEEMDPHEWERQRLRPEK